jgi:hypothetical protein
MAAAARAIARARIAVEETDCPDPDEGHRGRQFRMSEKEVSTPKGYLQRFSRPGRLPAPSAAPPTCRTGSFAPTIAHKPASGAPPATLQTATGRDRNRGNTSLSQVVAVRSQPRPRPYPSFELLPLRGGLAWVSRVWTPCSYSLPKKNRSLL